MGHKDLLVAHTYRRATPNARVTAREASASRLSSSEIVGQWRTTSVHVPKSPSLGPGLIKVIAPASRLGDRQPVLLRYGPRTQHSSVACGLGVHRKRMLPEPVSEPRL